MPKFITASMIIAAVMGFVSYSRLASAVVPPPYTAYQADINHDGRVNPGDQAIVASKVGQSAPLPTPTAVPQRHEAIVPILREAAGWGPDLVWLDASNYPAGSSFSLGLTMYSNSNGTTCANLSGADDPNNLAAIPGGIICDAPPERWSYYESAPLTLPAGPHMYAVFWTSSTGQLGNPDHLNVVARWAE